MTALVTLEGCPGCPHDVPVLAGFSLKPNFGPWAKLKKGKNFQKQGQMAALIGAATGNEALVALGAGRYMQGRGKVKSANRSIRTISDVGKAAAIIGGAVLAAPLAAGALGMGAGATAAGAGAGASAAGAATAGAGLTGAATAASGGGLLSTIGSGLASAGSGLLSVAASALPGLAAPLLSAGLGAVQQGAQSMGMDAAPIAESIQSGNYSAIPGQFMDMATGAAQNVISDYGQQLLPSFSPGGITVDPYATLTVDPASQTVTLERDANIRTNESGFGAGAAVAAAAAVALGYYFMKGKRK